MTPLYAPLFLWLEGAAERPDPREAPVFRPLMLAHPLDDADLAALRPQDWRAEWKWDGIRVQLMAGPGGRRIWSRGSDDISATFPDICARMDFHAVLDGELLVMRNGEVAPFRPAAAPEPQGADFDGAGGIPCRRAPLRHPVRRAGGSSRAAVRRAPRAAGRLVRTHAAAAHGSLEPIAFADMAQLAALRAGARAASIEGLMLKRADSPYVAGRVKGLWWKWKRDPLSVDAVLMYAQRGHGKRSSFYSDYTFDLAPRRARWRGAGPRRQGVFRLHRRGTRLARPLDPQPHHRALRPAREVEKELVMEVAFDAAHRSTRHKSVVALRFPRIARIRRDKPAHEADRLDNLVSYVGSRPGAAEG